jgi:hypothetical protein
MNETRLDVAVKVACSEVFGSSSNSDDGSWSGSGSNELRRCFLRVPVFCRWGKKMRARW